MGWTNEETVNKPKEMKSSSKILLGIIVCMVFIIILFYIIDKC